mmetsp:Transcript_12206/g.19333  ORF Transcript_12206/g.19333 Transcript_12206/m.19333 type:complete len:286 (+) Transcript_12206:459-1316(+)
MLDIALGKRPQHSDYVNWPQLLGSGRQERRRSVEEVRVNQTHFREDREQSCELNWSKTAVPRKGSSTDRSKELVLREANRHKSSEAAVELVWRKGHQPQRHLGRGGRKERLRGLRKARRPPPLRIGRPCSHSAGERRELSALELPQPRHEQPANLRQKVGALVVPKRRSCVHLLQQLRDLRRREGWKPDQHFSRDVFHLVRLLGRLSSGHQRLELEVCLCPVIILTDPRKANLSAYGSHSGACLSLQVVPLLGLGHIALQALEHLLHRICVFLRLRRSLLRAPGP